ncbi:MAG: dephospho-CoA kinase [Phycisphaerales bacterium]
MRPSDGNVLELRPSWLFTPLRRLGWLALCAACGLAGLALYLDRSFGSFGLWLAALMLAAWVLLLLYSSLERSAESYRLTPTHAVWESGIFRRLRVDAPLENIQHAVLYRSIRERIFGLGTIGLATAGSDSVEIVWKMIEHPERELETVRAAIAAAKSAGAPPRPAGNEPAPQPHPAPTAIPIIGLAGGIGAGKSEVGRILQSLGCLVIDSDLRAREALDRPEVRERLVSWWGEDVLSPEGRVDRSKIASIIFSDSAQRKRLEELIHPIVRQDRAAMIAQARASARPPVAIIVDAPLLFEAGLDKECDAVFFVDAPAELRLARVIQSRGWTRDDLRRREQSQLPLEIKKSRSTLVIPNQGSDSDLRQAVASALASVVHVR